MGSEGLFCRGLSHPSFSSIQTSWMGPRFRTHFFNAGTKGHRRSLSQPSWNCSGSSTSKRRQLFGRRGLPAEGTFSRPGRIAADPREYLTVLSENRIDDVVSQTEAAFVIAQRMLIGSTSIWNSTSDARAIC